jgi:hypothetical protein
MDFIVKKVIIACENGNLKGLQNLLINNPTLDISKKNEWLFQKACRHKHLHITQWLLQIKPDINISVNNNQLFKLDCLRNNHLKFNRYLNMLKWLQSLKPHLYTIEYFEDGSYKNHYIRTFEEERWEQRKCALWLASNESPCKECLFYRIPEDVSRYIISNYL